MTLITAIYTEIDGGTDLKEKSYLSVEERLIDLKYGSKNIYRILKRNILLILDKLGRYTLFKNHWKRLIIVPVLLAAGSGAYFYYTREQLALPEIHGHRGSWYGVENTLEAIQSAIDEGAEYAEIDIQLSSDNVPVVIHDSDIKRLTGKRGKVNDMTAGELTSIPLRQNGYTGYIPTFDEVLKYCKGKIKLNVEYKLHGHEKMSLVDAAMKVVEENDFIDQCVFQTLEYDLLRQMHEEYPDYKIGYVIYGKIGIINHRNLSSLGVNFISVEEGFVSTSLIKECHRAGMKIYIWTINHSKQLEAFFKMKVDGIITDEPDVVQNAIKDYYAYASTDS